MRRITSFSLCLAAAAAAAVVASCQKGVVTQPSRSVVIGGDASSAPRLTPPVPDSPSDLAQLTTVRPTLIVRNGTSNQSGARTYDFEVSDHTDFSGLPGAAGAVTSYLKTGVPEGANGTTSLTVDQDLQPTTRFYWRARIVQGSTKSDWSDASSFNSQLQAYSRAGELFDPLVDGTTLGTRVGATTFVTGKGLRIDDQNSYVRYQLVQPISSGEFSVEIEGLAPNPADGKLKLMSMLDGTGNLLLSKYLMNTQYRGANGNPSNCISFKIIFGDNDFTLEPDLNVRTASIRTLDSTHTYLWKATWNTEFRLEIFDGGAGGSSIYNFGITSPGGSYSPNPHFAYLGANNGLGEDAGSWPGAIYRNLWVGNRARPQTLGSALHSAPARAKKVR